MLKKILKVLIVIVLAYAVVRFVVVFKDSRLTGTRAPYIQMLSSNSVVIHWLTENNQVGIVHFGEDKDDMSTIIIENGASKNHILNLTGLRPATKYYYHVGQIIDKQDFDPEKHWFYTHPDKVMPTRVWVLGDSGKKGDAQHQVRDAALNWMKDNPLMIEQAGFEDKNAIDMWISLGDIAYRSGTNEQFQSALFDSYGDLLSNTALWPVYGNHDSRRWTYFRIFDLPENAEAGGVASGTENYYSVDYSNIHFVMLDSQSSNRSATGDMANWLNKDLAQNTRPWVIVAFHHPPYTRGSHDSDDEGDSHGRMQDMRENILPVLEKAGVDLVMSGHSHLYERSYLIDCAYTKSTDFSSTNIVSTGVNNKHQQYIKPLNQKPHQGTVYVVSGSAAKADQGPLDHPVHHKGLSEAGSLIVDIDGNKLIARFINNKGQIRDEFSITKEAGYDSGYQGCMKK